MEMMMNPNMYYMQSPQQHCQQYVDMHQQQQQQHHGYYDDQKMQEQCMVYQDATMEPSYNQDDMSVMMMNKRYRTDSVQLLRCRRRMDLVRLQQTFKSHPTAVARRNERERNRVKHINSTFANLRQHIPTAAKTKKMSKVDTLKSAIRYIKHLQHILEDTQCDDITTTQPQCPPLSPSESLKSGPATPSTCRTDSPGVCESLQDGSSPEQDLLSPRRDVLSPDNESASQGSPSCLRSRSPYASDDAGYDTLETPADDLADLVHWFQ